VTETTNQHIKNIVAQYQLEQWEEKRDGNHSPEKNLI
jgi:hypothetical protein